jgi:hypothetical protein
MRGYDAAPIVMHNLRFFQLAKDLDIIDASPDIIQTEEAFRTFMWDICPTIVKKLVPGTHIRRNLRSITVVASDDITEKYNRIRDDIIRSYNGTRLLTALPPSCYEYSRIFTARISNQIRDGFYLAGMKELPSGRLAMHLYPRIYHSDSTHAIHDYVRFAEGVQACSAAIEQYGLDNLLAIRDWLYNYPDLGAARERDKVRYDIATQLTRQADRIYNIVADMDNDMVEEHNSNMDFGTYALLSARALQEYSRILETRSLISEATHPYIHLYLKGVIDVLPVAKTMTGIAGHTYSTILPVSVDDVANAHQFIEMWDDEIQLAEESFNVDTEVLNTNITEILIQLVNGGAA